MCIFMLIEKPIPSTIYVVEADEYIYLTHPDQIPTCHTCGRMDHKESACTDTVGNGTNVVSLDGDVDDESTSETQEATIDDDEDAIHNTDRQVVTTEHTQPRNQADVNTIQTQNSTEECELIPQINQSDTHNTACGNTSELESTATTHQDTHTGENPIQCLISNTNLQK